MNILHVSITDLMGGRFTGLYMQKYLNQHHSVEMAVWNKTSENPKVHCLRPGGWLRIPVAILKNWDYKLGLEGLTGLGAMSLIERDYFKKADVIHLHLIHDDSFFSILSLPMLSRLKPLVWTIHDNWAMTGGCLYSFDCEKWLTGCSYPCPYPRHKSLFQYHIAALHWRIKKLIYKSSNLSIVVASKWMQDRIQKSPLLLNTPCSLIPFGIDIELFRPRSREETRGKMGISLTQKVIAFRDNGLETDSFKGMKWLLEALKIYEPQEPTSLLILQDGKAFQFLSPKYEVITPGWIDGEDLAIALSTADVFIMPSIQEAFGLMAIESMASGTPVITFEGTSLPDVIKAPLGGISVQSKNSVALAEEIKKMLEDTNQREKLGRQGRQIAELEYGLPMYVNKHVSLYMDVIEAHKHRVRANSARVHSKIKF